MTRRIFPISDWAPAPPASFSYTSGNMDGPAVDTADLDPYATSAIPFFSSDQNRMFASPATSVTEANSTIDHRHRQPDPTTMTTTTNTARAGKTHLTRSRSMSLLFSRRHRPKSGVLEDADVSRFADMTLVSRGSNDHNNNNNNGTRLSTARRISNRLSIDELRFASIRGSRQDRQDRPDRQERHTASRRNSIMFFSRESRPSGSDDREQREQREQGEQRVQDAPARQAAASSSAHGKKAIRGLIRRASVSIHGMVGRRPTVSGAGESSTATLANTSAGPSAGPSAGTASASTPTSHFLPTRLLSSAHSHAHSHSQPLARLTSFRRSPSTAGSGGGLSSCSPDSSLGDMRPTTSHALSGWRRLRQAASFRQSRAYDSDVHLGFAGNSSALNSQTSQASHRSRDSHSFSRSPGPAHRQPPPVSFDYTSLRRRASSLHPLDAMPEPRKMFFFPQSSHSQTHSSLSTTASGTTGSLPSSSIPAPSSTNASLGGSSPSSLGSGPPIIPPNTGGAARAAAAAAFQNELLQSQQDLQDGQILPLGLGLGLEHQNPHSSQQHVRLPSQQLEQQKWLNQPEDYGNDRESGIGIAVTASDADLVDVSGAASLGADDDDDVASEAKVDYIWRLPVELSVAVLAQLDAASLAMASRVSRRWHHVVLNQHIWRESFMREKTGTYATGAPVQPGTSLGVPVIRPSVDWRQVYRVKEQLDRRWKEGKTVPVYLNGHSDSIYCLQFDESKIITGSRDRTIRIWDMHTLECRLVIGPPSVVHDSKLLIGDDGLPAHYVTNAYHTRSSCSMPAAVSFPMHHSASILCLQYDDRILVTGSSDSSCIVYSVKSGYRPVRRLRHHTAAVLDLCFDERHIVTCSKDISICVWDRETGAMLKQLRGHSGPVNAVQMRGNTIVSCSGDFRVKLWDIQTGRSIRELTGHTKGLACSQFSEDGRFVASAGNDRVIRIWDANTGECVREMKAHENLVRSLHIDSVSGRLVSGSYDRDIKVFDMETGQQLLDFPQWHQSWVLSAKSDYRRIISTGQDPKVLVMDFGAGIEGIEMLETVEQVPVEAGAGSGSGGSRDGGGSGATLGDKGPGASNICGGYDSISTSVSTGLDGPSSVTGGNYAYI